MGKLFLIGLALGSLFGFCSVHAQDYNFWNELGQLFAGGEEGEGEYDASETSGEDEVCLGAGSDMEGICTDPDTCEGMALGYGNCTEPWCCCVAGGSCGANSSELTGYFTSPNYPRTFSGKPETCTFQVCRYNSSICKIRLDFLDFETSPPTNGDCKDDSFAAEGLPKPLCGQNKEQHVVLPLTKDTLDINSVINGEKDFQRKWKVKITQVPCMVPKRRSNQYNRCLQEFRDVSGKVNSFNYRGLKSTGMQEDMIDMSYTICIYMPRGYCSVEFNNESLYLDFGKEEDTTCTKKPFIVIPNGGKRDRFCGKFLPEGTSFPDTLISDQSPVIISVNSEAADKFKYGGFSLKYRQKACKSF